MTSRDYFKGKRIAVIGLDPHGEMVEDVKFLIKAGALVSVYDLKSEARLKHHLVFLRTVGLANYVCSSIPADDLLDMDMIVLSHEYTRDSSFLKEVIKKGIPIEYPETLFFKKAPPVTVIGIMGVCGKATVMSMLEPMLSNICASIEGQGFFVIDSETGDGIVAYLKKIKSGDIVLMRITESMMKELASIGISPHVAVFTTIPTKGSYVSTPFEILANQTYNNFIIGNDEIIDIIYSSKTQPKAKMLRTKPSIVPVDWGLGNQSNHDRDNASLAIQVARLFKVDDDVIKRVLDGWKSLKGRLELIKKIKDVEFYNDSASVSAMSTIAAIKSLSVNRNLILVFGGSMTMDDYRPLYSLLHKYVHTVVLLPGSGTLRERPFIQGLDNITVCSSPSVEEAANIANEHTHRGDRVIFSPGFQAVGADGSRKSRGERFIKAVRAL